MPNGDTITLNQWISSTVREKNELINSLVQRLYEDHRSIAPMHPWVLVYVLPREQKIGSLYVPGKHHKVSLEGIVLCTWSEYAEEKGTIENGVRKTRVIVHRSELNPGDHVVFPHWSGLPIPGMDENHFRIVKELGWNKNEEGGIFGIVDDDELDTSPHAKLKDILADAIQSASLPIPGMYDELPGLLAAKVEEQFLLVDKSRTSVTLSALHGKEA